MARDETITIGPSELRKLVEDMVAARIKDQSSGLDALRDIVRSAKPTVLNNPEYSEVSPFTHPEGERLHPGPKLTRKTFFCGGREREENLLHAEILAYNAITESCKANDGLWEAEVVGAGTDQILRVTVPSKTVDQRMALPSLLEILTSLKSGVAVPSASTLLARVSELEAKLADITTRHAGDIAGG